MRERLSQGAQVPTASSRAPEDNRRAFVEYLKSVGQSQPKGRNGIGVKVIDAQQGIRRPGALLDAEVRSWIENVIVPAMVREFMAGHGTAIGVAEPIAAVPECQANGRLSAEGIQ
jgi:hypothetical protein